MLGEQTQLVQHREDIDVVLAKAHPEADVGHTQIGRERVDLVVARQIGGVFAHHRQIIGALDLEHLVRGPLALLPTPYRAGELPEIDLRVEIGGKIAAVAAGVDIDDVDAVNPVEIGIGGQRGIGIDHTGVEAGAQNGGHALALAILAALPLVIAVPGRRLADFFRILVNGSVDIGHAHFDTGAEHAHIEESRSCIENDLALGLPDQGLGRFDIHRVELVGGQNTRALERLPLENAGDQRLAFRNRAGGNVNVSEHIVVHCCFKRSDLRDTSGADDQQVLFQLARNTFSRGYGISLPL